MIFRAEHVSCQLIGSKGKQELTVPNEQMWMHNITATATHNHCSFLRLTCEVYFACHISAKRETRAYRTRDWSNNKTSGINNMYTHSNNNWLGYFTLCLCVLFSARALTLSLIVRNVSHFDVPPHRLGRIRSLDVVVSTLGTCVRLFCFCLVGSSVRVYPSVKCTVVFHWIRCSKILHWRNITRHLWIWRECRNTFSNMNLSAREKQSLMRRLCCLLLLTYFPCYRYK